MANRPSETPIKIVEISLDEIRFQYLPNKNLSTQLHLTNKIANMVAYKIKTTAPKNYIVKPNVGMLSPGEKATLDLTALSTAIQGVLPTNDKFLIVVKECDNVRGASAEEFWKTTSPSGLQEQKLKVVFIKDNSSPQRDPSYPAFGGGNAIRESTTGPKNESELYVSMVNRVSEPQKAPEKQAISKSQVVSYVLGNPSTDKPNTMTKDFGQKNEEMLKKIEETERQLLKISEERNKFKQELTQMKTYGTGKEDSEKGGLRMMHMLVALVMLIALGLYSRFHT